MNSIQISNTCSCKIHVKSPDFAPPHPCQGLDKISGFLCIYAISLKTNKIICFYSSNGLAKPFDQYIFAQNDCKDGLSNYHKQ